MDRSGKDDERLAYDAFVEIFYRLGVNPREFQNLSGKNVRGYFPNLTFRKSTINVEELAKVLWKGDI